MPAISFTDIFMVIGITLFAGGTSFIGAIIGKYVHFSTSVILFLTAFGAGILISAAIFGMVIQAEKSIGVIQTFLFFIFGSIIFTIADVIATRKGGGADILIGIGLDTLPESLAIGASIAAGPALAIALLIGIQNIPEGIAAYKEMRTGKTAFKDSRKALYAIGVTSIIPVILGLIGLFFLQGLHYMIGLILALSAGGIFYMLFYDMIPKAHKDRKWLPTFGAVLGFIIGFAIVRLL
ncbi:MAG: ZIP family metal transporter [Nitrososphaeraceae archaeon]|jgi:ZIP family zinc transporter